MRKEVGDARRSRLDQASSSVSKVKEQTDGKTQTVLKASPVTRAKTPCLWGARCKRSSCNYRRHPVCRGCKSGNRCICGIRCLFRHADGEKKPSARPRKEGTQGAVAILRQKNPRLCISRLRSNEFYSTESWRIGIERFGGTHHEVFRMHLVRNWIRERKGQSGGIIQKGEPHERNPCAPGFEEQPPEETSREADCASKAAWNFARKNAHAEQERFKLRWKGYFKKVQKPCYGIDRDWWSASKRASTCFCSWCRSVRDSAIARRNASSSIAW